MMFKKAAILVMATAILFSNCSKKGSSEPPADTKLELTVKDNLGNSVSGASVYLYGSADDHYNDVNRIGSQLTNSSGIVTFTGLTTKKYYWYAQKGCINNTFGSVTTTAALTANVTNTTNTVMAGTGELRLVNTSSNPYRVYINGTAYADISGGTTKTVNYAAVGNYTIRVLQLSGYLVTPTDITYTGNLSCGGTLTTTFP